MKTESAEIENIVYLDNAATSFPKPPSVPESVLCYMQQIGANPGRSGHSLSAEAGSLLFSARRKAAEFFGIKNPMRVLFCANATEALNLAIQGLASPGDHVITSSMEHNSTIRPLREMERRGDISLTVVPCSAEGLVDPDDMIRAVRHSTRLMVLNHASNVSGTVQPLGAIGRACRERNIPLLADCAQSAGIIDIDLQRDCVDLLAFAGHKGLLGPTGTGGLVLSDSFDEKGLRPLKFGGTGSLSDRTEQPDFLPDRFESGTLNMAGISGLLAGLGYITGENKGLGCIQRHEQTLVESFINQALEAVPGFHPIVPAHLVHTGVVSFRMDGLSPSEIAQTLDERFRIMSRAGLHCAPLAHQTLGSYPEGLVRFSFGIFNTRDQVDYAVKALAAIAGDHSAA